MEQKTKLILTNQQEFKPTVSFENIRLNTELYKRKERAICEFLNKLETGNNCYLVNKHYSFKIWKYESFKGEFYCITMFESCKFIGDMNSAVDYLAAHYFN